MGERDELTMLILGRTAPRAADAILAAGYSKRGEELAKYKRGAKTLGGIIEKQCREVLDVTGLHHLINEDGDGAWDVVWMRLFEMRDELASLKESTSAIPTEAIEAAAAVFERTTGVRDTLTAENALEAAAPYLLREAQERAYDEGYEDGDKYNKNPYRQDAQ